MSMRFHRMAFALLLSAALFPPLPGCSDPAPSGDGSAKPRPREAVAAGEVFVYARGGDSLKLDPQDIVDGESAKIVLNVFDTLVTVSDGGLDLVPALATDWRWADGGLTLEVDLRDGVKFHDGTDFDSEAVAFTFRRYLDKDSPFRFGRAPPCETFFEMLRAVEPDGPRRVRFRLKHPSGTLLANLSTFASCIVSPTAMRKRGEAFARRPVGTGPLMLRDWRPDERMVFDAFPQHWRGPPASKRFVVLSVRDNTVRLAALRRGEADIIDGVELKDLEVIRRDPALKLQERPGMNICYLAINCTKKPFDDPRVRRAVAHAVDKAALIGRAYHGEARPAKSVIPEVLWGHASDMEDTPHDPARSRKLLAEAGYPDGLDVELWVMDVPRPYIPDPRRAAEVLKENLRDAGFRVRLHSPDWGTYIKRTEDGEHTMCVIGWSADCPDPDNFIHTLTHKDNAVRGSALNLAFYTTGDSHDLITRARQTPDRTKRIALYREAQRLLRDDAPVIPLAHTPFLCAQRAGVTGFTLQAVSVFPLRNAKAVAE
jgi:peptide/nickel transport system substrate-binding protein